jgi:hypothetical protein
MNAKLNKIKSISLILATAGAAVQFSGCDENIGKMAQVETSGYIRNNDGSIILEDPFLSQPRPNERISDSSDLKAICQNILGEDSLAALSNYSTVYNEYTGIVRGDQTYGGQDSNGTFLETVLCAFGKDQVEGIPAVPTAQERAQTVSENFPATGEVTIVKPFVLISTSASAQATGLAKLPIFSNSKPDAVCGYYGYGRALQYALEQDLANGYYYDYKLTANIINYGGQAGEGYLTGFSYQQSDVVNAGYYSITCVMGASGKSEGQPLESQFVSKSESALDSSQQLERDVVITNEKRPEAKIVMPKSE